MRKKKKKKREEAFEEELNQERLQKVDSFRCTSFQRARAPNETLTLLFVTGISQIAVCKIINEIIN